MDYVKAFVCGGIICVLTQILMEKTKLMPGRIMVILVTTGVVLGAVGIYEPFAKFAGAGATVPLTGFGNVLWKGMKKAIDEQDFLDCSQADLLPAQLEYRRRLYLALLPRLYLSLR